MEKREIGIAVIMVLVIVAIGFFGKLTGNVVNESIAECNSADFNADGKVDHFDKMDFGEEYDLNYETENYCGLVDINGDRIINILDSNRYFELYTKNVGAKTGKCIQRRLSCEGPAAPDLTAQEQPEIPEIAEGKPGFLGWIKKVLNLSP